MLLKSKKLLAQVLGKISGRAEAEIISQLEIPKIYLHGHLAWPVFTFAKEKGAAPIEVAKSLATELMSQGLDFVESATGVGGFLNIKLTPTFLQTCLFEALNKTEDQLGHTHDGAGKTVVLDYASPNVAKPMHIGHFRAAAIGQAIRNLAVSQGYKVLGVNHIGDWGTQFGKLVWAYQTWGSEYDFSKEPIDALLKLYVRFHDEAENRPELEKFGSDCFLKLEQGDQEIEKIWKYIVEVSLKEFNRIFELLKIKHDFVLGESFYNDKMEGAVARLEKAKLLQESEGAQVVFFPEAEKMPPCIIKKSDGASIYATRDLAAAIYRHEEMKGDLLLYVVGVDQNLHFRQIFKVLEMLGYPWAKQCHHISFGMYRLKDGKMSTRKGKVILAEEIIEEAVTLVKEMIQEKNPNLPNKDSVAMDVARGAIIFNDLVNDRVKNIDFDWARAVTVEGDSGPYVQYTNVRCLSLLRKFGKIVPKNPEIEFKTPEEIQLIFTLLQYEDVLKQCWRNFKTNTLAQYLLEVCSQFSHFYHANRILGESSELENSRICLVNATSRILTSGLKILNIPSPEFM